jgi:cytochrome c oxidase assembly protein subunit 15
VLALIVGMLLIAWTQKPAWRREGTLALAALALAVGLAVLGIATPGARVPAVTLGNLLGGYLMFAALCALVTIARGSANPASLRAFAAAVLLLVLMEAAVGASIGAQYALTACPTLPACPAASGGGLFPIEALNLFRPLSIADGHAVAAPDAPGLHIVHRAAGIAIVFATLALAYRSRRDDRRAAFILAAFVLAIPLLGAAAIATMPSLSATVLHNAATALLVGRLAAMAAP